MKSLICFLLCFASHAALADTKISALSVVESHTLPIVEISGLAWRVDPKTKKRQLVIVSDREHKIFLADWDKRKTGFDLKEIDIDVLEKTVSPKRETQSTPPPKKAPPKSAAGKTPAKPEVAQSEWESVFSDESGRIFIVKEHPTQVVVLNPELNAIETTIEMKVTSGGSASATWDDDANSKGEGLLPLKNGHMLVVKEKTPLSIIEFGPVGQAASGYEKELAIEGKGLFPLDKLKGAGLTAVASWQFSPELDTFLEDSSGINVDPEGTLYLLGDQRNMIVEIGTRLKPSKEKLKAKHLYSIPSVIKQPEGMVINEKRMPIIAIDSKKTDKPNLFLLSPLK